MSFTLLLTGSSGCLFFTFLNTSLKTKRITTACRASSDEAWFDWIHFMLDGVRSTSQWTLDRITASRQLFQAIRIELEASFGSVDAGLLDTLFEQPYCRISDVQDSCHVSRPTAAKMLNRLVDEGILHDFRAGRDRIFVNYRFMEVLTGAVPDQGS